MNYGINTEDTDGVAGSMKCVDICKRCYGGACILQAASQDLFGDCAGTTAITVRLNQAATVTCNAKCASYTHEDANCSGTSAACGSVAESCINTGTDALGTNGGGWAGVGGNCTGWAVSCSTAPSGGAISCDGYTTPWTRCRCSYDSR